MAKCQDEIMAVLISACRNSRWYTESLMNKKGGKEFREFTKESNIFEALEVLVILEQGF